MTPERHEQIGELYHRVLALPREQRPAVLDEACTDDPELRREVESLLAASDQAGGFMDTPAIDISARSLSADVSSSPRRIGRYALLSLLGRGGMGEVHLAEDATLGRKVAVKLLPAPLTTDAQAVLRFEQEARAASSLNHPNIVTIHEIGVVDGGRFIAMEFVEGRPLSALVGTPMPVETLLPIARQLAQALAVAHAAGIVHRDIKPENIMLRPDGYVKLLDFGIARLVSPRTGMGDSVAVFATHAGAVVGTPRYMSPEQIRGEAATAASDVFALGAVLFELATGRHLSEEPSGVATSALPTKSVLGDLVRRMLDQNPALRPRAAEIEAALQSSSPASTVSIRRDGAGQRRWLLAAGASIALVSAVALLFWNRTGPAQEQSTSAPIQFQVQPPLNTAFSPSAASLALSPDGKSLAFTASQVNQRAMALFIRSMDSLTVKAVPSVKTAGQLFWLPDSRSLAFADTSAQFALNVVEVPRGSVQPIGTVLVEAAGVGSASREHGILVRAKSEANVLLIPNGGGSPRAATHLDLSRGESQHRFPAFLPDGRHFLFLTWSEQPESDGMAYVGSLGSDERRPLFKSDSQVVYADPGYLLYMLGDTLLARPFDAATLQVTGEGRALAEQVERNSASRRGAFTVSQTGVLAYRQHGETQLAWYDRTGRQLETLGPPGYYRNPAASPDGKTIAVAQLDAKSGTWDIWTIDVERRTLAPVTTSASSSEDMPVWSPDGKELAYKSDRHEGKTSLAMYRQRWLADTKPVPVKDLSLANVAIHEWTHGGLLYSSSDIHLTLQPLSGPPVTLVTTAIWEPFARFSPDGKWLAYVSNETGTFEVYLTSSAPGHARTRVSIAGGTEPAWRKDGRELFYLSGDRHLMAVPIRDGQELRTGTAQALFQPAVSPLISSTYTRNQYVVSADGQRFLINEPTGKGSLAAITVVVNWPALLRN